MSTTNDKRTVLIASTASPYKFAKSVISALSENVCDNEFDNVDALSALTNTEVPSPIAELKNAEVRFKDVYNKQDMKTAVFKCLEILA